MSNALRRGDVRVRGALTPSNTRIEVFDGVEWLLLSCVAKVAWSVAVDDLPQLTLTLNGAIVDLMTSSERVTVEELLRSKSPDPPEGEQP
jgi:hypothetical protein